MTPDEAMALLRNGTRGERRKAIETLAALGDERAAPGLAAVLAEDDPELVSDAESALWRIWCRSGQAEADVLLTQGIAAMERRDFEAALAYFTHVIAAAPDFAEGYNKRATVLYLMGRYEQSIADCQKTLAMNPLHFGAASGQGLCHLALGQPRPAARCFRRALRIHPHLEAVRQNLARAAARLADGDGGRDVG